MASGFFSAIFSILSPPSAEAIRQGPLNFVVHESQIVFLAGVFALGDHYRVANAAFGAGLLGDQKVADHAFGRRLDFFRTVEELNAALGVLGKLAFTATTRKYLSFDDEIFRSQIFSDFAGF